MATGNDFCEGAIIKTEVAMSQVLRAAAGVAAATGVGAPVAAALAIADALGVGEWLTKHVLGSAGDEVAAAVVKVAGEVAGGVSAGEGDPLDAKVKLLNQEEATALRVRLAEIAAQAAAAAQAAETDRFKAILADGQSARAMQTSAMASGSMLAWAPALVSLFIMSAFTLLTVAVFVIKPEHDLTDFQKNLMLMLAGGLLAAFSDVRQFWLGSSHSSLQKSRTIEDIMRSNPSPGGGATNAPFAR